MEIRKATEESLDEILKIYAHARKFMAENGNATQWGNIYPPPERVKSDIAEGKCHICVEEHKILAVFYFAREEDPTYRVIREGSWLNEEPYSVVHRIASSGEKKGAAAFCLDWAYKQAGNIRIDTHEDNFPMLRALDNLGFLRCGIINCRDGSPRIAFQKIKE